MGRKADVLEHEFLGFNSKKSKEAAEGSAQLDMRLRWLILFWHTLQP
jgi:hypothetical protein